VAARGTGPTVEGGPQLSRAFRRFADRLDDLAPTHDAAAQPLLASARTAVPIVSGALLDTLRVEPEADGSAVVAGSDQVLYAGVIHFGWPDRNIDAQPYMPDSDADATDVAAVYIDKVNDLMRTFDREAP
jgi:hypothetical protein